MRPGQSPRDRLVAALDDGEILVVAGAGVSRALAGDTSPTWRQLVESGLEDIVAKQLGIDAAWQDITDRLIATGKTDDLVQAASRVENAMGLPEFGEWLKRLFSGWPVPQNHPLAHSLARLRAPMLTTNYDTVLERTLGLETVTWQEPQLVQEVLRGDESSIAHLHGVWTTPESVIFGAESYQRLLDSLAAQTIQQAMVVGRRLLLIGCGATAEDPNLGRLFAWLGATLDRSPRAHFALILDDQATALHGSIYPIVYGNGHDDLVPFLERLADDAFSTTDPGMAHPSSAAALRSPPAARVGAPHHNLPVRAHRRFVSRDADLAKLTDAVVTPGSRVVVEGLVGTGKTTLALEVCHRLVVDRPDEFDVVVWVTTHDVEPGPTQQPPITDRRELKEVLTTIAMVIDRPEILHMEPDMWAAATHAALARGRPLIVFDNFEAVRSPDLAAFVERLPGSCRAIITSRRKLGFGQEQHLEPLPEEPARQLAQLELSRGGLDADPTFVRDLARRSGGLPLAISLLVGQALAGPPHARPEQRSLEDEDVVGVLLDKTLQTLSGQLQRSGVLIAALMPGGVPASVLQAALSTFTAPKEEAGRTIASLFRLNLLEYDGELCRYTTLPVLKRHLARGSWLLQAGWRNDVKAARLALVRAFRDHLAARGQALWDDAPPTHADWELERPNVFAVIRIALDDRDFDGAGRLLQDFYTFAITFGHFSEFLDWTLVVLTSGQTLDPMLEGALRIRRVSILVHAARVNEAQSELRDALRVLADISLPSDLQNFVFFVRAVVGVSMQDAAAEEILREAIAFEVKRDVAWARLGFQGWLVLYLVAAGRLEEADDLCRQSLTEARERHDQRTEVFVLIGQTRLNRARGDWTATLETADYMLKLAEESGEEHNRAHLNVEVALAYIATGNVHRARSPLEDAERLYTRIGVTPEAARCRELLEHTP